MSQHVIQLVQSSTMMTGLFAEPLAPEVTRRVVDRLRARGTGFGLSDERFAEVLTDLCNIVSCRSTELSDREQESAQLVAQMGEAAVDYFINVFQQPSTSKAVQEDNAKLRAEDPTKFFMMMLISELAADSDD